MPRFLALLFALLLAACSKPADPIAVEGKGAPALWKVSSADGGPGNNGGTAYLFGTVHSLPPGTEWQGPEIDRAIRDSNGLVIEVIGLEHKNEVARIFGHMGTSASVPPLKARVPAEYHPQLDTLIGKAPMPADMLNRMKDWAAMLILSSAASRDWGVDSGSGVEPYLRLRFEAESKPVSGLETVEQQFGMFDRLSASDQRAMLITMLKGAPAARDDFSKLLDDWMAGRSDALLDKANSGLLASPTIREALLDGRGRAWTDKIDTMLKRGDRSFVAVGAGHMAGPTGLPTLLMAKGYTVERVQ